MCNSRTVKSKVEDHRKSRSPKIYYYLILAYLPRLSEQQSYYRCFGVYIVFSTGKGMLGRDGGRSVDIDQNVGISRYDD